MKIYKRLGLLLPLVLLSAIVGMAGYLRYVNADGTDPGAVTVKSIDYENMELTLNTNGNTIIYYSTNKNTWYEADGAVSTDTAAGNSTMMYDISWVSTGKTTIYFRGNNVTTTLPVVIPAYNKSFKVTFDKATGNFDFENTEDVEIIRWRKTTDYTWNYVWADRTKTTGTSDSTKYGVAVTVEDLDSFEEKAENYRVKGAKLIFQTMPVVRTDTDDGARPSKEVKVTIPAKRSAPSMKVNIKKLTVNTKATQEWSTDKTTWTACTGTNMELKELAPDSVSGSAITKLYFRSASTTTNCESKIAEIEIPSRGKAPTDPLVINMTPPASARKMAKASLIFNNIPKQGYEYVIIKNGGTLNEKTAAWKTVKTAKTLKYTEKSLPVGAVIYVREKGIAKNVNKGIDLKLPSQCFSKTVPAYPTAGSSTSTEKK